MDIQRIGSRPSGKGPAEWFTGTVRIDPLFQAPDPALVQGASVVHASTNVGRRLRGSDVQSDYIVHKSEIARLFTVAEDRRRAPFEDRGHK